MNDSLSDKKVEYGQIHPTNKKDVSPTLLLALDQFHQAFLPPLRELKEKFLNKSEENSRNAFFTLLINGLADVLRVELGNENSLRATYFIHETVKHMIDCEKRASEE